MALPELVPENILPRTRTYSEDEYFELEDRSPDRWEFLPIPGSRGTRRGIIRAMSGGTLDHSAIAGNLFTAVTNGLLREGLKGCRVFTSDLKVHTADGVNTFPDVSVVCGPVELYRRRRDTITNPVLVAEVLSPTTEAFDRGDKGMSYRTIPSLEYYLLLSADRPSAELYTRGDPEWQLQVWENPPARIPLPAVGVTLTLGDFYTLVDFTT